MDIIRYYEVILEQYNGTIYARIRFELNGKIEESQWKPLSIHSELIMEWKKGNLFGSFGIGTMLDNNAGFILCNE